MVKRKRVLKRVSSKSKDQKTVLKEALSDISREINRLKRERVSIIGKMDLIEKTILQSQNKENLLRDKITRLVQQESSLNKKKSDAQSQLMRLKERLDKIKKIEQEIKEV